MSFTFITTKPEIQKPKPVIKKNTAKILLNLVNQSLQKKERQIFYLQHFYEDDRKPNEILKEELSKPIVMNEKELIHFPLKTRRDLQTILFNLKTLKGLSKFLKFNSINESTLTKLAGLFRYSFYRKGTYIFHQGDKCDMFYGIISGEVSIRNVNQYTSVEREKTSIGPGMCFGEWALIYDISRTASAYATTDVELFYLPKDLFDITISKEIIKADIDKKNFVTKKIPALLKGRKIQNVLWSIIPCFFEPGNFVYTEFDRADSIYVLYQGECVVKKFLSLEGIDDPLLNKDKMVTLYKVDRGGILGIEALKKNSNYETNIEVSKEFTVLYKLKLSHLKDCAVALRSFLLPMLNEQRDLVNSMMNKEIEKNKKKRQSRNSIKKDVYSTSSLFNCLVRSESTAVCSTMKKRKIIFDVNKLKKGLNMLTSRNNKTKEDLNKLTTISTTRMNEIKTTRARMKKRTVCNSTEELRIENMVRSFSNPKQKFKTSKNLYTVYNTGFFNLPLISSN